jgi:hypothetical protein
VWLDVRVARNEPEAVVEPRFRRRIPLELTPAEFAQLEAAQPGYGSKRATLVAGLTALTQLDKARAEGERLAVERDAALAQAAQATERAEKAARANQAAGAKGKTTSRTDATKLARLETDLGHARRQLAETARLLAAERARNADWQHAYQEIDARRVDALRCPRCKQWADPDHWATVAADDGGQIVYHQPCGYHEDGLVNPTTIIGYRDAD